MVGGFCLCAREGDGWGGILLGCETGSSRYIAR